MRVKHMRLDPDYDPNAAPGSLKFRCDYNLKPNMICCIKGPDMDPIMCRTVKAAAPFDCLLRDKGDCLLSRVGDKGRHECAYYMPPCANNYPYVIFRALSDVMEEL